MKKINLVLQASGIIGISYIGAIKYLYEKGYVINKIAGALSGSLVGSLLAAGYTPQELEIITIETDFGALVGDLNLSLDQIISLLLSQNGVYTWDKFEDWLEALLQAKGIYTFYDLYTKGIVKNYEIMATDITRGYTLVLPQDLKQYNMDPLSYPVSKGVRMSSTIPYFFTPVVMEYNNNKSFISDGGILYDFPINLYDKDENIGCNKIPTIGIRVAPGSISFGSNYGIDVLHYTVQLFLTISNNNYVLENSVQNVNRTISIPTFGISALAFDLTVEEKIRLIQSGYDSAKAFIEFRGNCKSGKYEQ